ncbi:MAG: acetyl ornithine aminotransferase family protein [Anaerolineales bacterium]|nr:acetyl ornithine aminotransferase family protein [Anaerolineales bacterium]
MVQTLSVPGPKARAYLERDSLAVSPSYPRSTPLVIDHGSGSEVWDVDGNRFVDLAAGIAVCSTGHSHPQVVRAIQQQAERFIHISSDYYHPLWIDFSERLGSIAPFDEPARVFLGNSGTEAVEAGLKLARYHTGRQHFIGFYGGFHGRSMGSLSLTASKPIQRRGFTPMLGGVTHVPFPDPYRPVLAPTDSDYGVTIVNYIKNVVFNRSLPPEDCAAVVVEPILGEGGYVVPTPGFFPALRRLCDEYGILLIVDEVQTGVGRTGKWWAIEHWGVEPDIVCVAKGIASGVPLGATIARASIMDWPSGSHGNTYGGNPLACAAGMATLELIEERFMQNAAEVGEYTLDALAEIQSRHASIGDVRGKGLMIGVEFVKDRSTKTPAPRLRQAVVDNAFKHGLLLLGAGDSTVRLSPPLNITRPLMDEGLEALELSITEAENARLD